MKIFFPCKEGKFNPQEKNCLKIEVPKSEMTDRTFGIMDPMIHSDIANEISKNWQDICNGLFHEENQVCSYSFPIPLNAKKSGHPGEIRVGRIIYNFLEMENDISAIACGYKYIFKTDIKNFYPSIYTHSIPWSIHGKEKIRKNRKNYKNFFGNRLDKLFSSANDGYTVGIPIGPVVSDLVAELIMSRIDRELSNEISSDQKRISVVRFKDDYRILTKSTEDGYKAIKSLQRIAQKYRLELNEEKTKKNTLPNGIFRSWVSEYERVKTQIEKVDFREFRRVYFSVVSLCDKYPGSGIIERFLSDLTTKDHKTKLKLKNKDIAKVVSLLILLAEKRMKAFPQILGFIEALVKSYDDTQHIDSVVANLEDYLDGLCENESDNQYLISWILYFIRSHSQNDPRQCDLKCTIPKSVYGSRFTNFKDCRDFRIFKGVKKVSREKTLLQHLEVFYPV